MTRLQALVSNFEFQPQAPNPKDRGPNFS